MELLFALELLFIIRPGAAVYNSPTRGSGVLENALLLRCRDAAVYGAALLQMVCAAGWCALLVICWLSALALELLFELLFMELLFIIRPGAAVYGDAVYNSPWSCWCS